MATSRTLQSAQPGPVTLRVAGSAVDVHVITSPDITAAVAITTASDEGPSADAVRSARMTAADGVLDVRVSGPTGTVIVGGGGVANFGTIINSGGGVFIAGNSYGIINTDVVITGGQVAGRRGASAPGYADPITITAHLPENSHVDIELDTVGGVDGRGTKLADVQVRTQAGAVAFETVRSGTVTTISGHIRVGEATSADVTANSTSGTVTVGKAPAVTAKTVSGDIRVDNLTGPAASSVATVSGDIRLAGDERVRATAQSISGDVAYQRYMDVQARTVSGRVRTFE